MVHCTYSFAASFFKEFFIALGMNRERIVQRKPAKIPSKLLPVRNNAMVMTSKTNSMLMRNFISMLLFLFDVFVEPFKKCL